MVWKIFAWLYGVLTAGTVLLVLFPPDFVPAVDSWNFASWESIIESLLLTLGAFVFAYNKQLLTKTIWQIIFIAIVLVWIVQLIAYSTNIQLFAMFKANYVELGIGTLLLSMAYSVPALIAIYKLGFCTQKSQLTTQ